MQATLLRFCPGIRHIQPLAVLTLLGGAIALFGSWSALAAMRYNGHTDSNPVEELSQKYTFVGEDFPMYYPLDIRDVYLVPENTVHYGITGPDADEEWQSVFPPGRGFVQLGQERTRFGTALYHQMHCLDRIRQAIGQNDYSMHVHHCFNYLWQAILCEADATIEPEVPSLGDNVVKLGVKRTCKDWEQVYEAAQEGYEAEPRS